MQTRGQLWETDTVSAVALRDEKSPRNEVTYAQAIANITSAWWDPTPPPGLFASRFKSRNRNAIAAENVLKITWPTQPVIVTRPQSTVWAQCKWPHDWVTWHLQGGELLKGHSLNCAHIVLTAEGTPLNNVGHGWVRAALGAAASQAKSFIKVSPLLFECRSSRSPFRKAFIKTKRSSLNMLVCFWAHMGLLVSPTKKDEIPTESDN